MKRGPNIQRVDARHPEPGPVADACRIIQSGGVVAFPATSLYGLAADAFHQPAVEKIRRMKKRGTDNPILLLVRDSDAVSSLVAGIPSPARVLMEAFWPGMVTLVFNAVRTVPEYLTSGTGKIGLRVPAHPVARALVDRLGIPVTGTSANLSGQPGPEHPSGLNEALAEPPDLILDAGLVKGGRGTTVVDVTVSSPRVLREGAVPADLIFAALND